MLDIIWSDSRGGFPTLFGVLKKIFGRLRDGYSLRAALIFTMEEMGREVEGGLDDLEKALDEMRGTLGRVEALAGNLRRDIEATEAAVKRIRNGE